MDHFARGGAPRARVWRQQGPVQQQFSLLLLGSQERQGAPGSPWEPVRKTPVLAVKRFAPMPASPAKGLMAHEPCTSVNIFPRHASLLPTYHKSSCLSSSICRACCQTSKRELAACCCRPAHAHARSLPHPRPHTHTPTHPHTHKPTHTHVSSHRTHTPQVVRRNAMKTSQAA